MNNSLRLSGLLAFGAFAGGAEAQETSPRPESIDRQYAESLIVTGTRTERPMFDVPYVTYVLDSNTLVTRRQVRTIPEALGEVPGIVAQKTAYGQGSPYLRGFTGFRTLFMIDGIRLNNSTFREGPNQYWNTVDPLSLSRLEIIKGPSSVLYGSDAIGGTVNALTPNPLSTDEIDGLFARTLYRYGDAEDSSAARLQFGYKSGAFSVLAGLSYKEFGDLESGAGLLPKTGYDDDDLDLRIDYAIDDRNSLVFAHQQVDQDDAWRTHSTIYAVPYAGTTVGSELARVHYEDRDLTYVQYRYRNGDGFIHSLHASVSVQNQDEERYRERSGNRIDRQGVDVETTGLSLQLETLAGSGQWVYGAEAYLDDVSSFNRRYDTNGNVTATSIQGPVADDAKYRLYGAYVERQLPIGDRWELIPGIRYTRAEAEANRVEDPETGNVVRLDDSWAETVGSIRFRHELQADGLQLFGGISQGFRAPNLSDLTRLDNARSNEIETPVLGLDPERFVSYEVGLKRAAPQSSMQVAFFYTDVDDMIVRTPTGNIIDGAFEVTKQNAGDGFTSGIEFEGTKRLSRGFSLFGGFAWMDGEIDTFPTSDPVLVREPIDRLMPLTLLLGSRWQGASDRFWVEASAVHAEEQNELSTRDQGDTQRIPPAGSPGYSVLNLRSVWRVGSALTVSAAVANVTDQNYRIHGSGVNESGRNFLLTLDGQFR